MNSENIFIVSDITRQISFLLNPGVLSISKSLDKLYNDMWYRDYLKIG